MQAAETELKFVVDNVTEVSTAIKKMGLQLRTPRTFESNTLFDTPDRALRQKRQILRLRLYGEKWVMTHKRVADEKQDDLRYKTRIETETEVEDGSALAEVFAQLGFAPVFRYEKFRTEWDAAEGGHLVLDETPIGVWAELEGETAWIDAMLARLQVAADRCTTASYGMLFLEWKERTGSPVENLSFEEIEAAQVQTAQGR